MDMCIEKSESLALPRFRSLHLRNVLGGLFFMMALWVGLQDYVLYKISDHTFGKESLEDTGDVEADKVSIGGPKVETLAIEQGDTLITIIRRAYISATQAYSVVQAIGKVFNPRDLRSSHKIYLTYEAIDGDEMNRELQKLRIRLSLDRELVVDRLEEGGFSAQIIHKSLVKEVRRVSGRLKGTLYQEIARQGVHPQVIGQMLEAYSYSIDFQRSFKMGDEYCLVFEYFKDPETLEERPGDLLFACLTVKGRENKIYRFRPQNGEFQYFNENGDGVKKALLRTPIDGARVSSGFGKRRHPVLGYSLMHKGVDFAAMKGTPIKAAGDGRIIKIGGFGSYGNYIKIRHNNKFETAYAHLSRFSKGLGVGSQVRQGQTIGYVGKTGRATGCHLHYELLDSGQQINPKHIKSLPAGKLTTTEKNRFKAYIANLDTLKGKLENVQAGQLELNRELTSFF